MAAPRLDKPASRCYRMANHPPQGRSAIKEAEKSCPVASAPDPRIASVFCLAAHHTLNGVALPGQAVAFQAAVSVDIFMPCGEPQCMKTLR